MKYFSAEEAWAIIRESNPWICAIDDDNPNIEAARALLDFTKNRSRCPFFCAVVGFVLGRATGIREERARRKGALL